MEHFIHSCLLALVLYLPYRLFLKGSQGFQIHRFYLLAIPVVSALLPFMVMPIDFGITRELVNSPVMLMEAPVIIDNSLDQASISTPQTTDITTTLGLIYLIGASVALLSFLYKFARIQQWKDDGVTTFKNGSYITRVHDLPSAFSFLNHIFISDAFAKAEYQQILAHEQVHVRQKHSWDLLFYEFLRILFWFHPVPYLAQQDLKLVHEFIADEQTIAVHGKKSYYENLLKQILDCPDYSFSNPFFKLKTIKTRIAMIQSSQNQKFPLRKLLWILPILFASLTYTAATAQTDEALEKEMKVFSKDGAYSDLTKEEVALIKKVKFFNSKPREKQEEIESELFTLLEKTRKDYKWRTIATVNSVSIEKDENGEINKIIEYNDQELYEAIKESRFLTELDNDELEAFAKKMNYRQEMISSGSRLEIVEDVTEIEDLQTRKNLEKESVDVPITIVENVPTYPGCSGTNQEKMECMQKNIAELVKNNFNTKIAVQLGLTGRQTISVQFKINSEGMVENIKSRAKAPELQDEATRVVNLLPKMTPGIQRGQNVGVIYGLPIIFEVPEPTKKQE